MRKHQLSEFRLMTYNIGGESEDLGATLENVIKVITQVSPDILVIQEATQYQDADGVWHVALDQIAQAMKCENTYFGSTISMLEHMHVGKDLLVQGLFQDWRDWKKGNAIISRWKFVRLGDSSKPGVPRNVPLYRTPLYQGNRDTDPRYALLTRVDKSPIFPFVVGVHLTTLVAEREKADAPLSLPGRAEEAQILRFKQARRLLDLLRKHILEHKQVVFLLGDFNALAGEQCISLVLEKEGKFERLIPSNDKTATHPKTALPIDHIFVYPESRLVDYRCWIVDSPVARQASDHLPVVATVKLS